MHQHKRTESQTARINDVIVVGAGLSGLSAAKVCHDKGLNVLVLEARDRVGGQTLSDESGYDLGGSYFIQEHRNLFNLIAELGLKCQPDVPLTIGGLPAFYSNEIKSKIRHDDSSHIPFTSKFNILVRLDFLATKRTINELCMKIDLLEPWNSKNSKDLDSISFKKFIESTCYTYQVRNFFINFFTPINLTNEAEDCSLLFALKFIRSWGGVERCVGMESSGNTSRVVGGTQLLSTRLCQQIGEERVLLNKPVHTIDQQTNSELVTVITKDGIRYEASRVIVALPPNLQTAITFKPNSSLKSQLNHRSPPGLCTKVILYYDRAYWYENGFNGNLYVMDHKLNDKVSGRWKGKKNTCITEQTRQEYRRTACKTSSSSERDNDNIYASTTSLMVPTNSHHGDTRLIAQSMLKETKDSFYPKTGQRILEDDYCPISFATPDYSRGQPSLIAHICGDAWIQYHQIERQEDRIALVAKSYAKILHPNLMEPLSFKELNWSNEDYSRGGYTSIMTPGTLTKFGRTLNAPYGRIAFASSELSTYWPCTMEGAVRSGRKAALKILRDLERIDIDEQDILDDEEVLVHLKDSILERYSKGLLLLTKVILTAPSFVLVAALVRFSLHRISFRCSVSL